MTCVFAEEGEGQGASGRLFLRNLPFTTTEAELSDAFADFGDLQEVHLVLDRYYGQLSVVTVLDSTIVSLAPLFVLDRYYCQLSIVTVLDRYLLSAWHRCLFLTGTIFSLAISFVLDRYCLQLVAVFVIQNSCRMNVLSVLQLELQWSWLHLAFSRCRLAN